MSHDRIRLQWAMSLLLGWLMAVSPLQAEPQPVAPDTSTVVEVAIDRWEPYTSDRLPHQGLLSHLVRAALAEQGLSVRFHFVDWQQAYAQTRDGRMDASVGWVRNDARAREVLFSDALTHATLAFFHLRQRAFTWDRMEDLRGLRIGVVSGYSYGDAFDRALRERQVQAQQVESEAAGFAALLDGRIDLFVADVHVARSVLADISGSDRVVQDEHPVQSTPLHLIVSKATGAELLTHFNAGLRALHASGRYQRMVGGRGLIRQLARLRFLTEDNAPLNYVLEDRVAGASVAVVEAILNNLESSVTVHDIKVLPWARAYQELQAAEDAVLFSIVQTPERKPLFQWAGPIYRSNVVLFGRRADKLSGRRLKDFAGQVICAVRDDVGAQILAAEEHPQDLIYLVPHADYCARMLAVGRVGLWAFGRDTGFWHLRHNGQSADDFEVLLQLRESNRFIAFSRAVPSEVVQAFQQEIDVLHLSGGLDRLIETSLQQAEHRVRSTPTP